LNFFNNTLKKFCRRLSLAVRTQTLGPIFLYDRQISFTLFVFEWYKTSYSFKQCRFLKILFYPWKEILKISYNNYSIQYHRRLTANCLNNFDFDKMASEHIDNSQVEKLNQRSLRTYMILIIHTWSCHRWAPNI
jgi:hypothetical protein